MVYREPPDMVGKKVNIDIPSDVNLEGDSAQFELPKFIEAIDEGRTVQSITLNSPSTGTLVYEKTKVIDGSVAVHTYVNRSIIEDGSYPVNLEIQIDRGKGTSEVLSVTTIKRYEERKKRGDFTA